MKKRIIALCVLSFFLLFQCSSDDSTIEIFPEEDFNTHVQSLSYIIQPEEIETPIEIETISEDESDGNYTCNVKRYKAAPGFNELTLMDPTTDVIFPGAMINGESIPSGEYIPIIADRAPINISVSLQNIVGSPFRTIENPNLSSVRAAIHDIFNADVNGATPAQISFTMEEVHSEEQFNLAVGVNFKSPLTKMSSSFDFNDETKKSRIVVKFLQIYYTIDVDPNARPNDFFNSIPNTDIFGSVSPLYVSTVTYGRMALFTFESEYSSKEMKGAIDATFKSKLGNTEGGGNISPADSTKIESSTMNAVIFGGAGSSGVNAIHGIEGLKKYISEGGDYSKESPGAPLSYKMRYLKDNSVAKIVMSSEYNVRTCGSNIWKILLNEIEADEADIDDSDNICELYGEIKYRINDDGPIYTLWEVLRSNAVHTDKIEQGDDKSLILNLEDFSDKENDRIVIQGFIKDSDPDETETYNLLNDDVDDNGVPDRKILFDQETEGDYRLTLHRAGHESDWRKIYVTISIYRGVSE
jgi:thiol-activated cytolysin